MVLATFIFYPINWINRYGWRKLIPAEEQAFFLFFREVGQRMNLTDIPETIEELKAFTEVYEAEHFRYADSNRHVADSTVRIVEGWVPKPLRWLTFEPYPKLVENTFHRSYKTGLPAIEELGPTKLVQKKQRMP